jgi:hypothetical protein
MAGYLKGYRPKKRRKKKYQRLSKSLYRRFKTSIRLSRSLMLKKSNLFLELSSTSVEIRCNALEDKIISSRPDSPSS